MIVVTCTSCTSKSQVADDLRGKQVRCPKCLQVFRAGGDAPAPAPFPVIPNLELAPTEEPPRPAAVEVVPVAALAPPKEQPAPEPIPVLEFADPEPPPRPARTPDAPQDDDFRPRRRRRRGPAPPSAASVVWLVICGVTLIVLSLGGLITLLVVYIAANSAPESAETAGNNKPGEGKPQPIPQPKPVPVTPAVLPEDHVVKQLPAAARDVVVGGGGRYLVLYLPDTRQLTVFDVSKAEVVKTHTVAVEAADKVLIAAGMNKLVVVYPKDYTLERYSLPDLVREEKMKLTMKVPPAAIAMGSALNGPLAISGVDWPHLGETVLFDVLRLERWKLPHDPHRMFDTSPTVYLRASADGRLFACSDHAGSDTLQTCVQTDGQTHFHRSGGHGSYPVPGPDGKTIFTNAGMVTAGPGDAKHAQLRHDIYWRIPCVSGNYYLKFRRDILNFRNDNPQLVAVFDIGDRWALGAVALVGLDPAKIGPGQLPFDKRVHFIPEARLIVILPAAGDRLILHRFDPTAPRLKSDSLEP